MYFSSPKTKQAHSSSLHISAEQAGAGAASRRPNQMKRRPLEASLSSAAKRLQPLLHPGEALWRRGLKRTSLEGGGDTQKEHLFTAKIKAFHEGIHSWKEKTSTRRMS